MNRPRLLDLYCGAGGAAMGYFKAGFDVIGVDIKKQPHYPCFHDSDYAKHFEFHQADALEFCAAHGREFDAVHASPPCQIFSRTRSMRREYAANHYTDLLTPTRKAFVSLSIPWVIENVPSAPGPWDLLLCGTMFKLRGHCSPVHRHRYFQTSFQVELPPFACSHIERAMNVYTSGTARNGTEREFCDALGVTWGNVTEGMNAIPPAYTEYIGRILFRHIRGETE